MHAREVGVQNAGVTGEHHGTVPRTALAFVADGAAGDDGSGDGAAEDPGDGRTEHVRTETGAARRADVAGHADVAVLDGRHFRDSRGVPNGQAFSPNDVVRRHAAEVLVVQPNRFERLRGPAALPPLGLGHEGQLVLADERTCGARGACTGTDHFGFPANEDEPIDRLADDGLRMRRRGRRIQRTRVRAGIRRRHDLGSCRAGVQDAGDGGQREEDPRAHFRFGHRGNLFCCECFPVPNCMEDEKNSV